MKDEITVSVLMLAYNHEHYIDEAINGVVKQRTDFRVELIIADDCSTDGTVARCREWQQRYPHIVTLIENERNIGLEANFIASYKRCRGRYMAICEGDDYWIDPLKLQRQVDFLNAHPDFAICYHRVVNLYEADNSKSFSNGRQQQVCDIHDLAQRNFIVNVSAVFRHGLIEELPEWFSEVGTYDYALHMLNADYGKIYFMNKPMAVYRHRKNAIWSTATAEKQWLISLKVREHLLNYFKKKESVYLPLMRAYTNISISLIRHYLAHGEQAKADAASTRLLGYHPEWNREELDRKVVPAAQRVEAILKGRLFALLTRMRREVSKLIPIPQIK